MEQGMFIERGRKLTTAIIIVKIIFGFIDLCTSFGLVQLIVFGISCALIAAFYRGVEWVKYLYIFGGVIGLLISLVTLAPYFEYFDQIPAWLLIYLIVVIAINLTTIILLAASESIKAFLYFQKYGNTTAHYQYASQIQSRANDIQTATTKHCPFCGEQIDAEHKFCHLCGGNIGEKEEEAKKQLLETYKKHGITAVFKDEELIKKAVMYKRMYGKSAGVSFLKSKAKEMGFDEAEITEENIDILLEMQNE